MGTYDPHFNDDDHDGWDGGAAYDRMLDCIGAIHVEVTENPLIGVILGPDGEVLIELYERPEIGFHSAM